VMDVDGSHSRLVASLSSNSWYIVHSNLFLFFSFLNFPRFLFSRPLLLLYTPADRSVSLYSDPPPPPTHLICMYIFRCEEVLSFP